MASLSVSSSMEAISSSILHIPKFYESASAIQSIKTSSKHCGSLKMNLSLPKKANLDFGFRVFAVGSEISDEGNDKEEIVPENDNGGFSLVTEQGVSLSQVILL